MAEKNTKKKPEIPQPHPDFILPDNNITDSGSHAILHTPSPRSEVYQQTFQGHFPHYEN